MERSHPDWYRVLQVDPSANHLVIQAAYRVLAQIFHPDVSGDDVDMKRINAAWEVLGDARRRRQYDIERAGRHQGPQQPSAPRGPATTRGDAPPPARSPFTQRQAPTQHAASAGSATSAAPDRAAPAGDARPTRPEDRAAAPSGEPFGPVLRFGRYEGWTLGQVSRVDRPYLEWLRRAPAGRGLTNEIDAVLQARRGPGAVDERRTYETQRQRVHAWAPGAPTKLR